MKKQTRWTFTLAAAALLVAGYTGIQRWLPSASGSSASASATSSTAKDQASIHAPAATHSASATQASTAGPVKNTVHTSNNTSAAETDAEQALTDLLQKRISPAMRREINETLQPRNTEYVEIETDNGSYVDVSARRFSVPIAVVDDNDQVIVTDITQPLVDADAR
mgnify:CR=1 FL=1